MENTFNPWTPYFVPANPYFVMGLLQSTEYFHTTITSILNTSHFVPRSLRTNLSHRILRIERSSVVASTHSLASSIDLI